MDINYEELEREFSKAKESPAPKSQKKTIKKNESIEEAIRTTPRLRENVALPLEVTKVEHVSVKGAVIQGSSKTSLLLLIKKRLKQKDNDLR